MNAYLARGVGNWDLKKEDPAHTLCGRGAPFKTNKQTNMVTIKNYSSFEVEINKSYAIKEPKSDQNSSFFSLFSDFVI